MTLNELIERLSIMADGCGDSEVVIRNQNYPGVLLVAEVTTRLGHNKTVSDYIQVVIEPE